jgi:hypothetical protein
MSHQRLQCLQRLTWPCVLLTASLLLGCASYSPASLPARASIADAKAKLGAPSGEYSLAGGAKRLEYVRGPFGLHTYMLDFDASDSLVAWTQVLYEENFATIKNGTSSDTVLLALGHPAHQFGVWSGRQTMWAYRFDSPQCQWFLVGMNPQGQVASTSYGPDPRCEAGSKADRD